MKGSDVRLLLLTAILWLALAASCDESGEATPPPPDPKPGDTVRLRGTLGEDVDCRLFRADGGQTYSLSGQLRGYANGSKLCIYGTVAEASHCLTTPMIDVRSVRPWASCP